jgi:hypothetical protein
VIRRGLGRGRMIIVIGALMVVGGALPPWWTVGTAPLTDVITGNAFDFPASGIVVFLAALAAIAVVVLPYATREGEVGLDRPLTYGLLLIVAIVAFGLRVYQISQFGGLGLPDRAPGLYVTGAGLLVMCWAMIELLAERPAER